ncbi:MAG: peptidoglycan-associated lipoprotein Pal [Herminiimonas sp.]|nr:peptidoglycan-associated lipoprotein Pal [Herminiimonas sp.]
MRTLNTSVILLTTSLLLSACSSTKLDETSVPVVDRTGSPNNTGGAADPRSVGTVTTPGNATDPLVDPTGVLAKRSVYFDYDSYTVRDEFKPLVQAHSSYLSANKGRKILIQGNTDERGGREYNLALGQKRAEAVRKSLSLLGVPDSQVEAVSLGKEKPKALGSDEAAWAENRRADIVY